MPVKPLHHAADDELGRLVGLNLTRQQVDRDATEAIDEANGGEGCLDAEVLAAYVDGGLSPVARAEAEQHLVVCGWCRRAVALQAEADPERLIASADVSYADDHATLADPPASIAATGDGGARADAHAGAGDSVSLHVTGREPSLGGREAHAAAASAEGHPAAAPARTSGAGREGGTDAGKVLAWPGMRRAARTWLPLAATIVAAAGLWFALGPTALRTPSAPRSPDASATQPSPDASSVSAPARPDLQARQETASPSPDANAPARPNRPVDPAAERDGFEAGRDRRTGTAAEEASKDRSALADATGTTGPGRAAPTQAGQTPAGQARAAGQTQAAPVAGQLGQYAQAPVNQSNVQVNQGSGPSANLNVVVNAPVNVTAANQATADQKSTQSPEQKANQAADQNKATAQRAANESAATASRAATGDRDEKRKLDAASPRAANAPPPATTPAPAGATGAARPADAAVETIVTAGGVKPAVDAPRAGSAGASAAGKAADAGAKPAAPAVAAAAPAAGAAAGTPPARDAGRGDKVATMAAKPGPAPPSARVATTTTDDETGRAAASAVNEAVTIAKAPFAGVVRSLHGRRWWRIREPGTIEGSFDGGLTWTVEYNDPQARITRGAVSRNDDCWMVGANGLVLRFRTGRGGWEHVTSPTSRALVGVTVRSAVAATVTDDRGATYSTTDGGVTWRATPPPR